MRSPNVDGTPRDAGRCPDSLLCHAPSAGCPSPATPVFSFDVPSAVLGQAVLDNAPAPAEPTSPVVFKAVVAPVEPPPTVMLSRAARLLRLADTGRDSSRPSPLRLPKAQPSLLQELAEDWREVLVIAGTVAVACLLLVLIFSSTRHSSSPTQLAAEPLLPVQSFQTLLEPPAPPPLLIEAHVEPPLPEESPAPLPALEVAPPTIVAVDEWYTWWVQSGWSGAPASESASPVLLPSGVSLLGEWSALAGSLFLLRRYRAVRRAAAAAAAGPEESEGESTPTKQRSPGRAESPAAPAFPGFLTPAVSRFISFGISPEAYAGVGTIWRGLSPQSVAASVRRSVRIATLTKAPKPAAAVAAVLEEEPAAELFSPVRRSVRPRRMSTRLRGAL